MRKHKNVIFVQLSTKKGIVWKNIIFHEMTKILHTYGLPGMIIFYIKYI